MTNYDRRLTALETSVSGHRRWSEVDESYFAWMSSPSLVIVAGQFAKKLPNRRDALEPQLIAMPPQEAIRTWLGPNTYANYLVRLAAHREALSVHRSLANEYGVEWRRRHPTWRRWMTPDAYDAWEASLGDSWRPPGSPLAPHLSV